LTVLADMAVPLDDFDRLVLTSQIKDAEEDVADAKEDWQRDKLSHRLDQLKALQASLG
jgi:F-type H+-transporting ATPase subunit epsilon